MIFFSIGLPSRFAEWCDALTSRLVEYWWGPVEAVQLNRVEEFATAAIRSRAVNLLACCRRPAPRLQSEILQSGRPFVVALGSPLAALRSLIERDGHDLADATRAVASSCGAMLAIARAESALVLRPADARDAEMAAAAIAGHLGIEIDDASLAQLLDQLPDAGRDPEEIETRRWRDALPERARAIVAGALEPYVSWLDGEPLERLIWEPELFFFNEEVSGSIRMPMTRPVDLTGRPRIVVFGPYITLPPGPWSADVVLGFSTETPGMNLLVEITAGEALAQTRVTATREHVVEIQLPFTIEDSLEHPIEIRIWTERSAFDGRLALGYAAITPQRSIPAETRQRLVDALDL